MALNAEPNRRCWMGVLARAPLKALEDAWAAMAAPPAYSWVRPPETGLIMVRGRAGGTGAPFHLGEVPVTRCTLQTVGGQTGTAHVMGREHRHAELAALFDAMLQDPSTGPGVLKDVIEPLERAEGARRETEDEKTSRTRVDFFTMVRGE